MTSLSASSMATKPGDTSSVRSAAHARPRAALAFAAALSSQFSERVSAGSTAARAAGSQSSNRTSHSRTGPVAVANSRRRGFQTSTNATGNTGAKVTQADRRRRNDTRNWWRSSSVGAGAASLASATRSASICSSTIPAKTDRICEGERLLTPLPKVAPFSGSTMQAIRWTHRVCVPSFHCSRGSEHCQNQPASLATMTSTSAVRKASASGSGTGRSVKNLSICVM